MATSAAATKKVVSHNDWVTARTAFLKKEKEFSKLRYELSKQRRELPWEKVEKNYDFEGHNGKVTLSDLFDGRSQLIVYHFMFGPNWAEGCPSCSYLGDHFDGMLPHINSRDVSFTAISRGPMPQIAAFKIRMGWKFNWVSSYETDFNYDYNVSFKPEERAKGRVHYNYSETNFPSEEGPGASVFFKDAAGDIFHTYSTFGRGLDIFLGAYNFLDIAPKGRDEEGLAHTMAWVRHHDKYEKNQAVDAKAAYVEPAKVHDCCEKKDLA